MRLNDRVTTEDMELLNEDLRKAQKMDRQLGLILAPTERVARILWRIAEDVLRGGVVPCELCETPTTLCLLAPDNGLGDYCLGCVEVEA